MFEKKIIGSTSIRYYYPDFPRDPKDIDYLVEDKSKYKNSKGIEYMENPVLLSEFDNGINGYMSCDLLYTLKVSHLFWPINWHKHMFDIQFLYKKGHKINKPLFYKLVEYWKTIHGNPKRSDLNMSSNDFFNNAIKTEVDHDTMHTFLNPVPIYTKILKDGAEVEVCEEKFNNLSYEDKLELVREEIYIMSAERIGNRNYIEAYSWMLEKFIREHAPIFEFFFIVENYIELHRPKYNYVKVLNEKINQYKKNNMENLNGYSLEELEAILAKRKEDARIESERLAEIEKSKLSPIEKIKDYFKSSKGDFYEITEEIKIGENINLKNLEGFPYQCKKIDEFIEDKYDSYGNRDNNLRWYIYNIPELNINFKITGHYSSYNGTDYDVDDIIQVNKHEEVITRTVWK